MVKKPIEKDKTTKEKMKIELQESKEVKALKYSNDEIIAKAIKDLLKKDECKNEFLN